VVSRHDPEACKGDARNEPNLLTAQELGAVLAALPIRWRTLATLMAWTGLRFGEASAIRWEDIDETRGAIRVRPARGEPFDEDRQDANRSPGPGACCAPFRAPQGAPQGNTQASRKGGSFRRRLVA
jgi:integrase